MSYHSFDPWTFKDGVDKFPDEEIDASFIIGNTPNEIRLTAVQCVRKVLDLINKGEHLKHTGTDQHGASDVAAIRTATAMIGLQVLYDEVNSRCG